MLSMAYRNILRNRRRTVVSLIMIVFSALLVSSMRFLSFGMHERMIWHAVGLSSGYLQVAANGWLENTELQRALDVSPELLQDLRVDGVTEVSPRILGQALASHGQSTRFITVLAADPAREMKVTSIHEKIIKGRFLSAADQGANATDAKQASYAAVIGHKLADHLDADVGSKVALVGSQFDGSIGALLVEVVGIYKAQDVEMDANRVLLSLAAGREMFAVDAPEEGLVRYTSLALAVEDYRASERVFEKLSAKFPLPKLEPGEARENSDNYDPVVHNWEELNPGLIQFTALDQAGNEMFLAFLIIMMAFGILNNVSMSLHERRRELGILTAIGTPRISLAFMVLYETLLLLVPGVFLGTLLGTGLSYYLEMNPIVLTGQTAEAYQEMGVVPIITAIVDTTELWIAVLSLMIPTLGFVSIALRRLFQLKPVEAITAS